MVMFFKRLNKTIILTDTYPCHDGISINFSETNFWLFLNTKVKEYKKYISFIHNHACGNITI